MRILNILPIASALLMSMNSARLWAQSAAADDGKSHISQVTVYADRAEVTRSRQALCKAGTGTALFANLPAGLDARSLRGEVPKGAQVIGVSSRHIELDEQAREPERQKLSAQIEKLQAEQLRLQFKRNSVEDQLKLSGQYADYFVQVMREEMRSARPDTKRWQQALDSLSAAQQARSKQLIELSLKERKLQKDLRRLQSKLARFGQNDPTQALQAELSFRCKGTRTLGVSLSYVVPGATWRPEYDLRFFADKGKVGPGRVELTVAAVVQQSSGEDWDDARLSFSTAKPRLGSQAPQLAPIYVDGHEVGKQRVLVQGREDRSILASGGAAGAGPQSASLDDHGQSFILQMPDKVSVRSDGRPYWFPVDLSKRKARAALVATPKLRPFVYQLLRFDNPTAYPLLAGRMHVYRKGSYIGDIHFKYHAPGEPMEISLGIDAAFTIKREAIEEKDERGHLLSGDKNMQRAYRLTLRNQSRQQVPVELRENIPVSKVEQVRVRLDKKRTTRGYKLDARLGFVRWTLKPKPGQAQYVDLVYRIELPKDWQVR